MEAMLSRVGLNELLGGVIQNNSTLATASLDILDLP